MEDRNNDMVIEDNRKINYKKLYYENMKEIKISYDYKWKQLESIKESCEVKKITTQVLESMIEQLVENQVKETEDRIAIIKRIAYENRVTKYYAVKEL